MNRFHKYRFPIVFFACLPGTLWSQHIISGHVYDTLHSPLKDVMVTYQNTNEDVILGFDVTNEGGEFEIEVSSKEDSILLTVAHISYKTEHRKVANRPSEVVFLLSPSVFELKEIVIENPPVYKVNDTVTYDVAAFTSPSDRVIGDVIRKLPGIEVDGGTITYQGKPIQQYLINGLNLLDSRYSLANENLPADAVLDVQIIENHQPIRVLDSLMFSDRASLNVKLKKVTLTGSGKAFVGVQPPLWDASLAPMLFGSSFQTLNTLQSNNVGHDAAADILSERMSGPGELEVSDNMSLPQLRFVSIKEVQNPELEKDRWFRNRLFMANSNLLQKLRNGLELKGNVSYFNDRIRESGGRLTSNFVPGQDHIRFSEVVDNEYRTSDLRGGVSLTKNANQVYYKNFLKFGRQLRNDRGQITINDTDDILQNTAIESINLSNEFATIKPLGNQLISFGSKLTYFSNPQSLSVNPVQFESVLGFQPAPDDALRQAIGYRHFEFDNYISMVKGIGGFTVMPKVGMRYRLQRMESSLSAMESEGEPMPGKEDLENKIRFPYTHVYANVLTQYRRKRFKSELAIQTGLREFNGTSLSPGRDFHLTRFTAEPRAFMEYQLSPRLKASLSVKYDNLYGGINQLYHGYVLNTYNDLRRFTGVVPESAALNGMLALSYQHTPKAFFANLRVSRRNENNQYIAVQTLDARGASTLALIEQENTNFANALWFDASKFLPGIKTTLKVRGTTSFDASERIVNEHESTYRRNYFDIGIDANSSATSFLNFSYSGNMKLTQLRAGEERVGDVIVYKHAVNVFVFPFTNQTLEIHVDYYKNNRYAKQRQVFVDLSYRLAFKKSRLNLELSCVNLLNSDVLTSVYSDPYSIVETHFQLRPRQFITGIWFRF